MEHEHISTDEFAEQIVGRRPTVKGIIFSQPAELGYHCPVCQYPQTFKTEDDELYDQRLQFSEYNGFLWCEVCNKDYPSVICQPNIDKAIDTYLLCVWDTRRYMSYEKEVILQRIGQCVEKKLTEEAEELSTALTILEKYYPLKYAD